MTLWKDLRDRARSRAEGRAWARENPGSGAPAPLDRKTVVFLDCGDTLADEATEVKHAVGHTLRARLIPGAARTVRRLARRGYTLALVADGFVLTFVNILKPRRLWNLFRVRAISETVGVDKPDPAMFRYALDRLGVPPDRWSQVVMVGNNLERDIAGAKDLGLTTVWIDWAPRRRKNPLTPSEVPDYTIRVPLELVDVVDRIDAAGRWWRPLAGAGRG